MSKATGEIVGMDDATQIMQRYQQNNPDKPHGFVLSKEIVRKVLNRRGCELVKIMLAENPDGSQTIVAYPCDATGNRLSMKNPNYSPNTRGSDKEGAADKAGTSPPW